MTQSSHVGSSLTDRYVQAVLREVPEAKRADLGPELRSSITDMVEARVEAGEPAAAAEHAVLTELGEPARLAAQYTGARLQLLGPRFFLVWKCLTLRLVLWVPPVIASIVAVVAVLQGGHTVGEVITDAVGAAIGTGVQVVFWTTLVFAILDRVVTEDLEPWTPDRLPEPRPEREYPFGEMVGAVAWNLVVAGALVWQHFRSWVAGADGEDVPVLDPDLWQLWLPVVLGLLAASVATEVWKYRTGWTAGALAATVLTSVATGGVLAWLAVEDRLLNPAFVDAVGLGPTGLDRLNDLIAVGVLLVAAWEVGDALVRHVRHRRG